MLGTGRPRPGQQSAGMTMSQSQASIAQSYDAQAAEYDRRWAHYVTRSTEVTLAALPRLASGARVLDVGCGTGVLQAALREREPGLALIGVDVSAAMLARAADRLGAQVTLCQAPAEQLPFDEATFDVVVSASSLHHWPDPARGLAEMARVLKASGLFVLTDWCRESWPMRLMDGYLRLRDPSHHRALTRCALAALVAGAGLSIDSQTLHRIGWLWQLQVLSGRPATPDASQARDPDPEDDHAQA